MPGENPQTDRILAKLRHRRRSLNPVLSTEEVAAFESAHEIKLPDGYRDFLLMVGNGGIGPPGYGIYRLGQVASDMSSQQQSFWRDLPDILQPFPFTRPWVWENEETSDEGTEDQVQHGSLCLGSDGCGLYWHLIITGPERGNVWAFADVGIGPLCPKRDFLTWYEDWLDEKNSVYG
jgi:hypothetical protein